MKCHKIERKIEQSLAYTDAEIKFIETHSTITKEDLSHPIWKKLLLYRSLKEKQYEVAELIIKKTSELEIQRTLHMVCQANDSIALKLLLTYEQHLMNFENSFLMLAINSNNELSVQFLIANKVDVNKRPSTAIYTPLHKAVDLGNVAIVRALLEGGANPNKPSLFDGRPIDTAILLEQTSIISLLLTFGCNLPEESHKYIHHPWPLIGQIEVYDADKQLFYSNIQEIKEKISDSKKDAAVLFFGEYEIHDGPYEEKNTIYSNPYQKRWYSRVPKFEAISKHYDPRCRDANKRYEALSKHFTLFRVLIRDKVQMELALRQVKSYLNSKQQITHLVITAHSNFNGMELSYLNDRTNLSILHLHDDSSIIKKIFSYLSKDATIALTGCRTAAEAYNISQKFSDPSIAKGRLVFGAPDLVSDINFTIIHLNQKPVCLPFFSRSENGMVGVYKNGEKIAEGVWPLRSSL